MLWLCFQNVNQFLGCVVSGSSLMDKDNDLLAHAENSKQIVKYDVIHDVIASLGIAHFLDSVKGALQGCWTIGRVKTESALAVCIYKFCHVKVVWKGG